VYILFIMFDNTRYKNQNCIVIWRFYRTIVVYTVRRWSKRRYAAHTCIRKACGYLHVFFLQIEFTIGKHFTSIGHCLHRTGSIQLGWLWINNVTLNFICHHNLLRTASYQLFCFCHRLCEASVRIVVFFLFDLLAAMWEIRRLEGKCCPTLDRVQRKHWLLAYITISCWFKLMYFVVVAVISFFCQKNFKTVYVPV
jgi:hypothetical protein